MTLETYRNNGQILVTGHPVYTLRSRLMNTSRALGSILTFTEMTALQSRRTAGSFGGPILFFFFFPFRSRSLSLKIPRNQMISAIFGGRLMDSCLSYISRQISPFRAFFVPALDRQLLIIFMRRGSFKNVIRVIPMHIIIHVSRTLCHASCRSASSIFKRIRHHHNNTQVQFQMQIVRG